MKTLIKTLSTVAPIALVSACALLTPTLVEQGTVRMDIEESEPVSVTQATAYRENGSTVVQGEVAFSPLVAFGHFTGHIDIEIDLPDGKSIKKQNVRLIRNRIPRKTGRRAHFSSKFALEVSKGTTIKVGYHEGAHSNAG